MLTKFKQDNPFDSLTALTNHRKFEASLQEVSDVTNIVVEGWIATLESHFISHGIQNARRQAAEIIARLIVHEEYNGLLLELVR